MKKLHKGLVQLIETRDAINGRRNTYFGIVGPSIDGRTEIIGCFQRFITGWIIDSEVEFTSRPLPVPGFSELEKDWIKKNLS